MLVKGPAKFPKGYNEIARFDDKEQNSLMDFGILSLGAGESFSEGQSLERAYLLINGKLTFSWDGNSSTVSRRNCFDDPPFVLHVPKDVNVVIDAVSDCEIAVTRTENDRNFASRLYTAEECEDEMRGAGTMRETSTRIVRTVFDYSNAPYSNLVIGEVIGFPGRWSSYPPHYHPQPEIYFYRFLPEGGFGYAELNDDLVKTRHNSTVFIVDSETHPQVTAPGYAMWYLWVIRHIDGNPYTVPVFLPEHLWVRDPDAEIWPAEA
ncbi:MAG: 5-deoxy-glucuronate isomerase [Acutalibacteraceae bacterium]|jgi:5-deoxy-glucuronate isomerase